MPDTCAICNQLAEEVCPDGTCRACHKSVSWEECTSGTWNAKILIQHGHPPEEVQRLYPHATIFPKVPT